MFNPDLLSPNADNNKSRGWLAPSSALLVFTIFRSGIMRESPGMLLREHLFQPEPLPDLCREL